MAVYKTPGVYIEEVPKLPASVASVETAFPAFIGYTPAIQRNDAGEVVVSSYEVRSMIELEQYTGTPGLEKDVSVDDAGNVTADSNGLCYLYHAVRLFFANGGSKCCVISVGEKTTAAPDLASLLTGLEKAANLDQITLLNFPDAIALSSAQDYYSLCDQALLQCASMRSRMLVTDVFRAKSYWYDDVTAFRTSITNDLSLLIYGAAYFPRLKVKLTDLYNEEQILLNLPSGVKKTLASLKLDNDRGNDALLASISNQLLLFPASPAVCGVYAKTDEMRGVWKAPANADLTGVNGVELTITTGEQDDLNIDPVQGKSINALRLFPGRGNAVVWGARTLAGNDNEWRYVPVRRLFIMVEQSVSRALQWAVFEPNDANTWFKIKGQMENYLTLLWRDGALQGSKTEHAFFVNIGLNSTMTANDVLEGRLIVELGLAAVRPAEFIVLRIILEIPAR